MTNESDYFGDNKLARVESTLPSLVTAFLEFSYSSELADVAKTFIGEHAEDSGFKLKSELDSSGAGHPLQWSVLHSQYCDVIDFELREFCKSQSCPPNELKQQIEDALASSKTLTDALPGFVKLCSYNHFCEQMEAHACLDQTKYNAAELSVSDGVGGGELFNGEWSGMYNFNPTDRDLYYQELGLPWVIRKVMKKLFTKEGNIRGIILIEGKGEAATLSRVFDMGLLGKQREITYLHSDEEDGYATSNVGFGKFHLKCKTTLSDNGRLLSVYNRRFTDNTRTERYLPSTYTASKGLREVVQTWEISEDGQKMVTHEFLWYPKNNETSKGWSYESYRIVH